MFEGAPGGIRFFRCKALVLTPVYIHYEPRFFLAWPQPKIRRYTSEIRMPPFLPEIAPAGRNVVDGVS